MVAPELTEGPYYVDVNLERSDIRTNTSDGTLVEGATPHARLDRVAGRRLGVHADGGRRGRCLALRRARRVLGRAGEQRHDFLRGFQRTDANGRASFTTVYPGWYQGRAVHIHFKIRTDPDGSAGFEFTSQLFFDDEFSKGVFATGVYAQKGAQDQLNSSDQIYNQSGGATLLSVTQEGDAYKATFPIAVQLSSALSQAADRATAAAPSDGAPQSRSRDHRAEDRPDRQPPQELRRRSLVDHQAGRRGFGPRTAITDTIAIPSQATIEAPTRL